MIAHRLLGALMGVAVLLAPGAARAVLLQGQFVTNFHPPNPCAETTLGDLSGHALGGGFALFARDARGGEFGEIAAPPGVVGLACGASARSTLALELAPGTELLLAFFGELVGQSPGPPGFPLFAFAPGTEAPDAAPDSPPLLALGAISASGELVGKSPGPPDFPLFAFASPGHAVGSLAVSLQVVPEPGALALLGVGLAGLALGRRNKKGSKPFSAPGRRTAQQES